MPRRSLVALTRQFQCYPAAHGLSSTSGEPEGTGREGTGPNAVYTIWAMDARERSASETERRPTTRRRHRRNGHGSKRGLVWLRIILVTLLLVLVCLAAAVAGTVFAVTRSLPSLDSFHPNNNSLTTFFYDVKGNRIGGLVTAENRVLVTSSQIPQVMKDAIVAIEDKRFYQHHGVDFSRVFGAIWADIKAGSMVQGASTIEGQYVDNAYLGQQRSFTRKIREMWLAWQLDDKMSKDEILTNYLNTIPFGQGAYGVGMASQVFFRKSIGRAHAGPGRVCWPPSSTHPPTTTR